MTAWNDTEWKIQAPSPQCAGCGRLFEDGESIVSRLSASPGADLSRTDLCTACAARPDPSALSSWRTTWRRPPPVEEPLKRETAESLLRRLLESRDDTQRPAIFVLAVMLERKRVLVERDVQLLDNGDRRRVYEHRRTGEVFTLLDPRLRLDDLAHVQADVVRLLGSSNATTTPVSPS